MLIVKEDDEESPWSILVCKLMIQGMYLQEGKQPHPLQVDIMQAVDMTAAVMLGTLIGEKSSLGKLTFVHDEICTLVD